MLFVLSGIVCIFTNSCISTKYVLESSFSIFTSSKHLESFLVKY